MNRATVPCQHCGTPTTYLGTRECDRCHELWRRVQRDPDLARRALAELSDGLPPSAEAEPMYLRVMSLPTTVFPRALVGEELAGAYYKAKDVRLLLASDGVETSQAPSTVQVPLEPTPAMVRAGAVLLINCVNEAEVIDGYKAMIAAAGVKEVPHG